MKIFITFSGEKSKAIAIALREWLPKVLQATEPWISEHDIEKGRRWGQEILKIIGRNKFWDRMSYSREFKFIMDLF